MYHKHRTEGIIIKGKDRGEGNKIVAIFSKEFGLIYATVQNGRSQKSKHRSHIEDLTVGNFSLIRGKHGWKLVGAEARDNIWVSEHFSERRILVIKVLYLVSKLVGEEQNIELYNIVQKFLTTFDELTTMLSILKNLGYVKENDQELIEISKDKKRAIKIINNSLSAAGII